MAYSTSQPRVRRRLQLWSPAISCFEIHFSKCGRDVQRKCYIDVSDALDMSGAGISAPVLYLPNGDLQSGCGSLSRRMMMPYINNAPTQPISECDWVTGASLFCRHEVFESIGFDGSYFLGCEDLDIGYRAKLAGWRVVVVCRQALRTLAGRR